ncbi:MAG: hypothetical protein IPK08_10395 [Bacteroidetes bacterium]|nr:hypothetical protein [Bacteroidota bacterium]
MKKHLFITGLCLQTLIIPGFGQGCSDAGFCTIGALKDNGAASEQTYNASLAIGVGLGMGLEATSSITSYLDYNHAITSKWNLGAKITGESMMVTWVPMQAPEIFSYQVRILLNQPAIINFHSLPHSKRLFQLLMQKIMMIFRYQWNTNQA